MLVDSVDYSSQNVAVLSILLALALIANLSAFPVILFRRTRFGNGQFACLILCLTVSDLLTVSCGLLGGLILEAGDMAWLGSSGGCAVYYFITSWLACTSASTSFCPWWSSPSSPPSPSSSSGPPSSPLARASASSPPGTQCTPCTSSSSSSSATSSLSFLYSSVFSGPGLLLQSESP